MPQDSDEWSVYQKRVPAIEAEWDAFVAATPVGSVLAGTVLSHHPFGFFVDLGFGLKCIGLVEIPNVADPGVITLLADYPPVGSRVDRALVLDHTLSNRQARLTVRPIDLGTSKR